MSEQVNIKCCLYIDPVPSNFPARTVDSVAIWWICLKHFANKWTAEISTSGIDLVSMLCGYFRQQLLFLSNSWATCFYSWTSTATTTAIITGRFVEWYAQSYKMVFVFRMLLVGWSHVICCHQPIRCSHWIWWKCWRTVPVPVTNIWCFFQCFCITAGKKATFIA